MISINELYIKSVFGVLGVKAGHPLITSDSVEGSAVGWMTSNDLSTSRGKQRVIGREVSSAPAYICVYVYDLAKYRLEVFFKHFDTLIVPLFFFSPSLSLSLTLSLSLLETVLKTCVCDDC